MLKNYIKVAWRHIRQNKLLSIINIFGLATGMTFALLIYMWILYEKSFDAFHVNKDKIGIVVQHVEFNHVKSSQSVSPLPLYYELKNNYPEVEYNTRLSWIQDESVISGDKKLVKKSLYVDPDFLRMFTFPLLKGDVNTVLNNPNSIVISASMAQALFGNQDPIGKTIRLSSKHDMLITGVMKDIPENSTYIFDFLGSYEFIMQTNDFVRNSRNDWGNNFMMNMVQVKENASLAGLEKKITRLITEKDPKLKNRMVTLQAAADWHLYNNFQNWKIDGGRITLVRLFSVIGIFVLLVACMNFMNLTTARSARRAREVGVRKAAGSTRRQLMLQFLSESMLTAMIAFVVALALCLVLLPYVRHLGFEHIHLHSFNLNMLGIMLAICLGSGLLAGSYPAFYLSGFKPLEVLKGKVNSGKDSGLFRKTLVVSQFVISSALIICTIIVYQQIKFGQGRSIGYNPENLITVRSSDDLNKNYQPLRNEVMATGYFESVARASQPMTALYNSWSDFTWEGKSADLDVSLNVILTEWDMDKTVGLKFKQGRGFSQQFPTDSTGIIINEAALKVMGFKDPLGKIIRLGSQQLHVIGVIENVLLTEPFKPVAPLVMIFTKDAFNNIFLRPKPGVDMKAALAAVTPIFEKYNPTLNFNYSFTDRDFAAKFDMENQAARLAGIFGLFAIFISCLGLFGLAMFMAQRRTREIGIRKVLGATTSQLWLLLSTEFIWLVLLACLLASPVSWYAMHNWLEHYEYRINISWWIFPATAILALIIAIATVSTQSIRAALLNPAKSLKTE
ncbi:ABC-type antimicrobial peptide transport system, permease component [Chitinophaga jiangningensis]|uniref:ABC-type antimicrobial peptide transport system, permease component n=1 Tax=Chitinophaga jiangningensis TaxID=1419482 RepID=A0A1M7CG49_9BACT|nr:ABC transporter permease [Chitinophaga jiangningensis]SHL65829.1 ABC-type antimicrobial peptide transport system, permease component [Chitinophaga jiangningensis]